MKKVAYIIPGGFESVRQKPYKEIATFFKAKGIEPIPVEISWKHRTMNDYVNQFMKIYRNNPSEEVYLLGFSFGAMVAFISSAKIKPKMQILCSLSPFFKEDLPSWKNWQKRILGKKRVEDLKNYSFNYLSRKVFCETKLIVGSKELKVVIKRSNEANKRLKNSEIIISKGAKHKISQKEYLKTVQKVISGI